MFKKVIIASAATALALLGAAGVAYADDESDSGPAADQQGHSQDLNLDNGASRNLDTGHVLGFLSI